MSRVVQAKCPTCSHVLRIPADWLSQPMRCKHCRQIFQSRPKNDAAPVAQVVGGATAPVAVPVAEPTASFGFADEPLVSPGYPLRRRNTGGGGVWLKLAVLGFGLAGIAAALVVFAGPQLANLFSSAPKDDGAKDKIVEVKDKPAEDKDSSGGPKDKAISTDDKDKKDKEKSVIAPPIKDDVKPPRDKKPKDKIKKDADPPIKDPSGELFPRRALLINVSNYLLFNPLHYGSGRDAKYPGSSTAVLADQFTRPPMNMPATQITELADGAKKPFSTTKPVIEAAITDFLATSRDQDRVIVLFSGHAIDIDKEAYLVPVEGNRTKPETLIKLGWVYEQLASCKARQKVLILDVFRFPPARGEELPGAGEMTEDFEAKLQNPPDGVQVWASCMKGQQALEFESGSLFLQALCNSLQERGKGIAAPASSLPIEALLPRVNQRMKELLSVRKMEQQSALFGKEPTDGAAYNAKTPLAAKLELKLPESASPQAQAMLRNMLEEINVIPSPRGAKQSISVTSLPLTPAKVLEEYKADYKSAKELETMVKDKEKYPLRAAYFEVQKILKESEKIRIKEFFASPGTPVPPAVKKAILAEQQPVGIMQFELKEALDQLLKAGAKREEETSKRWQVNYDLAVARLKARLVYLNEYNEILAKVRGDALPDLNAGDTGFRVGSNSKLSTKESEYKKMEKDVKKSLAAIAKNYPDTPWAVIAQRESMTALGLVWRASRD